MRRAHVVFHDAALPRRQAAQHLWAQCNSVTLGRDTWAHCDSVTVWKWEAKRSKTERRAGTRAGTRVCVLRANGTTGTRTRGGTRRPESTGSRTSISGALSKGRLPAFAPVCHMSGFFPVDSRDQGKSAWEKS
eukprot:2803042-Prymnesium_polylepis.1